MPPGRIVNVADAVGGGTAEMARRLGMTTTTLYVYVNGDGTPKAPGQALLDGVPYRKERLQAA